jgi:2-polyprenyl-3-methyl-5-hydroxy-6-metoxy-1,4-benzoquinol methylase
MKSEEVSLAKWHEDEEAWWDKYGNYMSYQWKLTPSLNKILRAELERDYVKFLLNPNESLLDLGCGSGWLSLYFAERGMNVLGVDLSQQQINASNSLKAHSGLDNLGFECCDFVKWNPGEHRGKFANVFVNAFLHHLPEVELEMIFSKIAAVLKPGGKVYLYEPLRSSSGARSFSIRAIDAISNRMMNLLLNMLPRWFDLFSDEYKAELKNGYQMSSPHEDPIDIELIKKFCSDSFEVIEMKGWHLFSLGFAMQSMALKESVRGKYAGLAALWFRIDTILLRMFDWQDFSQPHRFILCSVKLLRK